MAFKARKTRQRKEAEPVAQGRQLIPPAAAEEYYRRTMDRLIDQMSREYVEEAKRILAETPDAAEELPTKKAADAKESKIVAAINKRRESFKKAFDYLRDKWARRWKAEANKLSAVFVDDVEAHSKATMKMSLKTLGIEQPNLTYSRNIASLKNTQIEFNNTLITGLQEEYHKKIYESVMLSLTSPDPEAQGQPAIIKALNEVGIKEKKRAKLIARDQTSKVYSAFNEDRMRQNGVTHFRWVHSSAAKVPRQTHLDRNDQIFALDDPRLWQGPKADQGPPGFAINCGCRAVPVLVNE